MLEEEEKKEDWHKEVKGKYQPTTTYSYKFQMEQNLFLYIRQGNVCMWSLQLTDTWSSHSCPLFDTRRNPNINSKFIPCQSFMAELNFTI